MRIVSTNKNSRIVRWIMINIKLLVQVDELTVENRKKAESLIPILTEEFCKMLFSR